MKKILSTLIVTLSLVGSFSVVLAVTAGDTSNGTATSGVTAGDTNTTTTPGTTNGDLGTSVGIENPLKVSSLEGFIKTVLNVIIKIGVYVVAVFIILAGLQFVLARGNGEKLEKAKQNLLWVLIGAAILLGCWVIAEIISGTINALM